MLMFRLSYSIHRHTLVLDVIKVLDGGTVFNLAKVDTVPCMRTASLSPPLSLSRQRVDGG